jgi:Arc/MetJ-type ribon-helix-helix transcriptional regulator
MIPRYVRLASAAHGFTLRLAFPARHAKLEAKEIPYMTIHLPQDVENSINAQVLSGQFASLDDAMTQAARLLLREMSRRSVPATSPADAAASDATPDPILGLMRDDTDLMDEIVAEAYRRRRDEPWRDTGL